MIKVAIAEDELLLIKFLSQFLNQQDNINCVHAANSGHELLNWLLTAAQEEVPNVFILDMNMPGPQGTTGMQGGEATIEALKQKQPEASIIVMSTHYQKVFTGHMLRLGVAAFIPKDISPATLLQVIESVVQKGYYFTVEQIEVMRQQVAAKVPKPTLQEPLTKRELEIINLVCQEYTSEQIGQQLFISKRTVEGHKARLFEKTNTKNIAGLVVYAFKHNLIEGV